VLIGEPKPSGDVYLLTHCTIRTSARILYAAWQPRPLLVLSLCALQLRLAELKGFNLPPQSKGTHSSILHRQKLRETTMDLQQVLVVHWMARRTLNVTRRRASERHAGYEIPPLFYSFLLRWSVLVGGRLIMTQW